MTYKVNDVAMWTSPTTGRWLPRSPIGKTGQGRSILPAYHEFEMQWQLVDASGVHQMQEWWDAQGITGTSSVDIPEFGAAPYAFKTYSGVFLEEPEVDYYFAKHYANVTLRVSKINVL